MIDTHGALIHPEVLALLARSGHGAKILVSDANFDSATLHPAGARVIHLGVRLGLPAVSDVLDAVLPLIKVQGACFMRAEGGPETREVQNEVRPLLGDTPIRELDRADFYAEASSDRIAGIIVTGDGRRFGNVILELAPILI